MAALLMRQVVLFVQSRSAAVLATIAASSAADSRAAPAEADIEAESAVMHASLFAWLASSDSVAPVMRTASVKVGVACSVLLPMWAGLLVLKICLGYSIRRFVQWYNQYYDRTFMRLFKSKR